jgi:hypothetical protein
MILQRFPLKSRVGCRTTLRSDMGAVRHNTAAVADDRPGLPPSDEKQRAGRGALRTSNRAGGLFQALRSLCDDAEIRVLLNVQRRLHETEVARHIDILLQRGEIRQHVGVVVGIALGE